MSASTLHPSPELRTLQHRIAGVRRKRVAVRVTAGLALAVTVLFAALTIEAALDWLTELPWLMRALVLSGTLAGAGFLLRREVTVPLRTRLPDDAVALLIEQALPALESRYISSIQLARAEGLTSGYVRALLAQTAALAATLDFRRVVKTAGMRRALLAALVVMATAAGLGWAAGPAAPVLLRRAVLLNPPVPRKTQIVNLTGDRKIGLGEDLKIEASASGVIPARGVVVTTTAKGQRREFPLEAEPDRRGHFSALLRSPQESFHYVIKLNDATSPASEVTALVRPVVMQLTCRQILPPYLNLPPVSRPAGDLKLLAGSRLQLTVQSSSPIAKASLRLTGLNREEPLAIDPKTPSLLHGELLIPPVDLTGFSVHLVDTAGIESGESAIYRIDLVPDRPPTVKITFPARREELATPAATSRIGFEATDDFGLARAALHYTLGASPEKTIPFDLAGSPVKTLTRRFEWKLTALTPRPQIGDVLEYWIVVEDSNAVSGPGQGVSDHFQTRIVTEDEKRLDLANRLSDTIGGLGEVAGSQEQLNKTFGEIIFARAPDQR